MGRKVAALTLAVMVAAGAAGAAGAEEKVTVSHALSLLGEPKYGPGFEHLDYADPNAPKGGKLKLSAIGGFDSLNPFIIKGEAAAGIGLVYESLMTSPRDDVTAEYGLIAESIEVPEDQSWAAFNLRPEARWHDGTPITPEDVIFSFETLKKKGSPFYRFYYADVVAAEKVGPRKVKFTFSGGVNCELPQIMGQLPIISKAYFTANAFEKTSLEPPLGSGPYRVKDVDPGRSITYQRVTQYWGRDLPINRGRYNFDTLRYDYYRDTTVELEAFKAGEYDYRAESVSKNWATAYDSPAVRAGRIIKEEIPHQRPTGMQAFVFNTRRPLFEDPRVRQALAYAFDFEWTNKNLFYGQYTRTKSYFSNSDLASSGLPGPEESKILERYRGRIPEEVFTTEYTPPSTDGRGTIRNNVRKALRLLEAAGWDIKDTKLVNAETGQPFEFEILLNAPIWERIALPFVRNLARLGIKARVRTVDSAQYENRNEDFDFDMIVDVFGQSESPGNEQRDLWGSASADQVGGRNTIGIKNPVIDELIDKVIARPCGDRSGLIAATRALDRVLLWGHYVIPHWHIRFERIAYWNKFGRTDVAPKYGTDLFAWWIDAAKEKALAAGEQTAKPQ
jgi:microcin C transport system substrate-binding protein